MERVGLPTIETSATALEEILNNLTDVKVSDLAKDNISLGEHVMLATVLSYYEHEELNQSQILSEILKGAYVQLDDEGHLYDVWSQTTDAKLTPSSHNSDEDQLSVRGRLTKVILFSKLGNSTWLQAERYPVSPLYVVPHLVCWAQYRSTGRNQGPRGSSQYREANPLVLIKKS